MSESHEAHHHIVPIPLYVAIFVTLLIMTGLTILVAFQDWGEMNIILALGIAAFKASLVVLYFMHVRYASKLTQLASVLGFVWLAIMIGFTYTGIATRDWVGGDAGWARQPVDEAPMHSGAVAGAEHAEGGE